MVDHDIIWFYIPVDHFDYVVAVVKGFEHIYEEVLQLNQLQAFIFTISWTALCDAGLVMLLVKIVFLLEFFS